MMDSERAARERVRERERGRQVRAVGRRRRIRLRVPAGGLRSLSLYSLSLTLRSLCMLSLFLPAGGDLPRISLPLFSPYLTLSFSPKGGDLSLIFLHLFSLSSLSFPPILSLSLLLSLYFSSSLSLSLSLNLSLSHAHRSSPLLPRPLSPLSIYKRQSNRICCFIFAHPPPALSISISMFALDPLSSPSFHRCTPAVLRRFFPPTFLSTPSLFLSLLSPAAAVAHGCKRRDRS